MEEEIKAYSVKEVAEMLHLPLSTLSFYCRDGDLPCFKIGRHYRILHEDLVQWIKEKKENSIIL